MATLERTEFGGWRNCLRLREGEGPAALEVVATLDVGPRLVRFGRPGGDNELGLRPAEQGLTGGDTWRIYGGHRLWHAPEHNPRTYQPDNEPIRHESFPDGCRLIQPVEQRTGIEKVLELRYRERGGMLELEVAHRLGNHGAWPVLLAPWGITVMAPGGVALLPQPASQPSTHLLPNRTVVLWPYTPLGDPRLEWRDAALLVRPAPASTAPLKVGIPPGPGWCAYANRGRLFLKRTRPVPMATYPDLGAGFEVYAAGDFLELESLGPLTELPPGSVASHTEYWSLHDGIPEAEAVRSGAELAARAFRAEES